jgi:hypothetical protein
LGLKVETIPRIYENYQLESQQIFMSGGNLKKIVHITIAVWRMNLKEHVLCMSQQRCVAERDGAKLNSKTMSGDWWEKTGRT